MHRLRVLLLLSTLALAPATMAVGAEAPGALTQPAAPAGYAWYEAKNGVGSFLKPDGWFVSEEVSKNTHALFITREAWTASKSFSTGLTVNQNNQFSRSNMGRPSAYVPRFLAALSARREIIKATTIKGNASDMHVLVVRDAHPAPVTIVHYILVPDDANDILYLIFFEAPESSWQAAFEIARPMLDMFALGR